MRSNSYRSSAYVGIYWISAVDLTTRTLAVRSCRSQDPSYKAYGLPLPRIPPQVPSRSVTGRLVPIFAPREDAPALDHINSWRPTLSPFDRLLWRLQNISKREGNPCATVHFLCKSPQPQHCHGDSSSCTRQNP